MARKKIVFVIVEGPSDDTALGVMFTRFYDKNLVRVEITHGDITTRDWAGTQNIAARIGDLVRHFAAANHFKVTDFQEVIHIVDTDGAFIPDDAVVEDLNCFEPFYSLTNIRTDKPAAICRRNEGKSAILTRLASLKYVWKTIPYRIYYMSCNLDHVLHNKQNSSDAEKENDAYSFAKRYRDHLPEFLTFICNSDFSVRLDYKESWDFIHQGLRSLERHSNLGLCFQDSAFPFTREINLTAEEIEELRAAEEKEPVFDADSPEMLPAQLKEFRRFHTPLSDEHSNQETGEAAAMIREMEGECRIE